MRAEFIDTLIIGGGQAGLAVSHMLSLRSCPNIVVERQRIAERWRTERTVFGSNFPTGRFSCPIFHSHMPTLMHSQRVMKL